MTIPPQVPLWLSAAAVGLLATFWQRAKAWLTYLGSLFVCTVQVDGIAASAMALYLHSKMRRTPGGIRRYLAQQFYVRPAKEIKNVAYENVADSSQGGVFWLGGRPLWFGPEKSSPRACIRFLRGTFDADRIMTEAINLLDARTRGHERMHRFHITRYVGGGGARSRNGHARGESKIQLGESPRGNSGSELAVPNGLSDSSLVMMGGVRVLQWEPEDLGPEMPERAVDLLSLCADAMRMVREVSHWRASKEWYATRSIPWRRGYLLHGPPGTGKTSLVRAIGCDEDLPVCTFDLGSMSNEELFNHWNLMLSMTPCIALFEDIDAVFEGRHNVLGEMGGGLSFDALLNCIGGIERADGVLLVVTTNHPEKLDPSLGIPDAKDGISSRPGRLDGEIHLGAPDEDGRLKIARRILDGRSALIEQLVAEGVGDTPAQFQERCSRVALELHWSEKNDGHDDCHVATRCAAQDLIPQPEQSCSEN